MKIAEFSVKNYQFTVIIFMMALLLGMNALFNMPRGEDPPFGAPIFIILAVYPGTGPADMEELVADPLEDVLYELEDIKRIDTNCEDGVMIMKVEFTYGDPLRRSFVERRFFKSGNGKFLILYPCPMIISWIAADDRARVRRVRRPRCLRGRR